MVSEFEGFMGCRIEVSSSHNKPFKAKPGSLNPSYNRNYLISHKPQIASPKP